MAFVEANLRLLRRPPSECSACRELSCEEHGEFDTRVRGDVTLNADGSWSIGSLSVVHGPTHAEGLTVDERASCEDVLWECYRVEVLGAPHVPDRAKLAIRLGRVTDYVRRVQIGYQRLWRIVDARGWPAVAALVEYSKTANDEDLDRAASRLEVGDSVPLRRACSVCSADLKDSDPGTACRTCRD